MWSSLFTADVDEHGSIFEFESIKDYNDFKDGYGFSTARKGHRQMWHHGGGDHINGIWEIIEPCELPKELFEIE